MAWHDWDEDGPEHYEFSTREAHQRETHTTDGKEWVTDLNDGGEAKLRYVGKTSGWYVAPRWSQSTHFPGHTEEGDPVSGVYFIQARPSGMVKIGYSNDVYRRLGNLQTAHHETLFVVDVVPGPPMLEENYHDRYAKHRIRGEWFSPEVLNDRDVCKGN